MIRNLDITALRSFVAVTDAGGVTRAANMLNLTQSAVSMQLKRLEDALDTPLLDRTKRSVALTGAGEQVLHNARKMIALNDDVVNRMTNSVFEGELRLGVPHDVIYPTVPKVLKRFAAEFPRMRVRLVSAPTRRLLDMFDRNECDFILTTEDTCGPEGETLTELPLIWIGARDGIAWRQRPLQVAFCTNCIFRNAVQQVLSDAGIAWEMAVESDLDNAVDAVVSADLAVHAGIAGGMAPQTVRIDHGGALPELGMQKINLYARQSGQGEVSDAMARIIRQSFQAT